MDFQEMTAVITGASRGLGRAVALRFGRAGANLGLFARTPADLQAVAREVDGDCRVVVGDVSEPDDVRGLMAKTRDRFGRIDVLINNAGIIGPARFLADADPDAWEKVIGVNLDGVYLCCREVLPMMTDQGGGHIVNITSGLSRMAFPRFAAYCAAKAGVEALTRCLAEEFREKGIRVNAVDPGVMDTPMQERLRNLGEPLGPELARQFKRFKEKGELKPPEAVADRIAALVVSTPSKVTGEVVSVGDIDELTE
jgi:NAD(P)-dependent dehydrogenase (short-subunit alcohol dehydrogenase family)